MDTISCQGFIQDFKLGGMGNMDKFVDVEGMLPQKIKIKNTLKLNLLGIFQEVFLHISKYHIHESFRLRKGSHHVGVFDLLEHFRKIQDYHVMGLS